LKAEEARKGAYFSREYAFKWFAVNRLAQFSVGIGRVGCTPLDITGERGGWFTTATLGIS
jgi:hypothetical protein